MELGIEGKVAIVTGSAAELGIGNAVANELAREGAHIVLTDIVEDGISRNAARLREHGARALAIPADQSNLQEVAAVVEGAVSSFGAVDILVHCAAMTGNTGSILNMNPDAWRREVDVSLNGSYYWLRECLRQMLPARSGRIVSISSLTSLFGSIGVPGYVATKGGLNTLTRQVARDYASKGITANVIVPGLVDSELSHSKDFDAKTLEAMKANIPLGRAAEPGEIASLATYLCSRQAAFITGDLITIDGGTSLTI